jgi:hypothetical protein
MERHTRTLDDGGAPCSLIFSSKSISSIRDVSRLQIITCLIQAYLKYQEVHINDQVLTGWACNCSRWAPILQLPQQHEFEVAGLKSKVRSCSPWPCRWTHAWNLRTIMGEDKFYAVVYFPSMSPWRHQAWVTIGPNYHHLAFWREHAAVYRHGWLIVELAVYSEVLLRPNGNHQTIPYYYMTPHHSLKVRSTTSAIAVNCTS